ncbi:MAG: AAA family ATPase, partial [Bacteroidales bacterium]
EGEGGKSEAISTELNKLVREQSSMRERWLLEKSLLEQIQKRKEELEQLKLQADEAERAGNYGKVAEIRYGKITAIEGEVTKLKEQKESVADHLINESVDSELVAEVVSRWTGIPVSRMVESERDKLLRMEEELHRRVIGQEEAISAISNAVRRSRAGMQDPLRPIGSFLFLGSTGVGKTELAKSLAEFLFNDQHMITRIDMSEYQERHSVSRLVGAPPGYIGYDEGGQLTEAVRRKPYSVLLLDEMEKAHPDVYNILLQVLDDGRLTDNKGRVVDFKNTILIMTSNIGSGLIRERLAQGEIEESRELFERSKEEVMELLKSTISPEFLNRIDEIVMFHPLTISNIKDILKLQIAELAERVEPLMQELHFSESAIEYLAQKGFDPIFGARPIKRLLQREVSNPIAKALLEGELAKGGRIMVERGREGIEIEILQ